MVDSMRGSKAAGPVVADDRIERTTTAADVTTVLRRRILGGRYKENEFIRQDVVAAELGVSRIPVREALASLEAEGLVVRVKYKGAVVSALSFAEIEQIYELREMLEPYLLRHTIARITRDQVRALRKITEKTKRLPAGPEWAGMNTDFHRALFDAADKPLALQVLDNLLVRADRYLKLQNLNSSTTKEESDAQHSALLDLVEKRDVAGAEAALRDHIRWNAQDVRTLIELESQSDA